MITKPMLAGKLSNESNIKFPVYATPKLDGIRCLVIDGRAVTRKFKPVPNKHIREQIERFCQDGFDGEIMAGDNFSNLQSLVMSEEGTPDFEYHVFDYVNVKRGRNLATPYITRIADLIAEVKTIRAASVKAIIPDIVPDLDTLLKMEQLFLKQGYEGIMLRTAAGPYKCGRSTVKEGYLLKLKRFLDSEAEIIDTTQLFHNANKAEKDVFGYTKHSSKKEGKIPLEKLGGFIVKDVSSGLTFKVASGLTDEERVDLWKIKETLIGKLVKYKYQKVGMKELPRFPVFLGFRERGDL